MQRVGWHAVLVGLAKLSLRLVCTGERRCIAFIPQCELGILRPNQICYRCIHLSTNYENQARRSQTSPTGSMHARQEPTQRSLLVGITLKQRQRRGKFIRCARMPSIGAVLSLGQSVPLSHPGMATGVEASRRLLQSVSERGAFNAVQEHLQAIQSTCFQVHRSKGSFEQISAATIPAFPLGFRPGCGLGVSSCR